MRAPAMRPSGAKRPCRAEPRHPAKGMAVVSVLLVVAVIAVLAAALLGRQSAVIRAAQTEQTRAQASWLLRSEISRAQRVLRMEAQRDPATRPDGLWSRPVNGEDLGELEGAPALVFTEIADEQAKFNLRNLMDAGRIDIAESTAFLRLCALAGVSPEQAGRVARRVIFSLVEAQPPTNHASEDAAAAQSLAQRLGIENLPLREQAPRLRVLEDLLGTPGLSADTVARLKPYVTVLPQRTWININTATAEVLAAWVPGLSLDRARALVRTRDEGQWFINRADFANRLQMPEFAGRRLRVGISSYWFRVSSALRVPRTTLLMQALVHDDKESLPRVVWLREGA